MGNLNAIALQMEKYLAILQAVMSAVGDKSMQIPAHVASILEQVTKLLSELKAPSGINDMETIIVDLNKALDAAKVVVPNNAAVDFAQKLLKEYSQTQADFLSGQAAVLASIDLDGVPALIVAVKKGGPAAASLGV